MQLIQSREGVISGELFERTNEDLAPGPVLDQAQPVSLEDR